MALNIIINKVSVAASFAAGATVATAVASGGTAPYVYSLATGGDKFAINSSTGVVTTIAAIDINNIASFSVTATDSTTGTALTITSDVIYPPIQAAIRSKFNRTNVIYKITKDIDLGHGVLTIPGGCTLDFQGGSFVNGKIECTSNTSIHLNNKVLSTVSFVLGTGCLICDGTLNGNNIEGEVILVKGDNVTVRNINISIDPKSSIQECSGIHILDSSYCNILNCKVHGSRDEDYGENAHASIFAKNSNHITIDNCEIAKSHLEGIYLISCKYCTVSNCKTYNTGYSGIATQGGSCNIITNNIAHDTGTSCITINDYDCIVSNNIVYNNGQSDTSCLTLGHSHLATSYIKDVICIGNQILGGKGNGLVVSSPLKGIIQGNIIKNVSNHGIFVTFSDDVSGCEVLIEGNFIQQVIQRGINIYSIKYQSFTIRDNIILSIGQHPIFAASLGDIIIENNKIKNSKSVEVGTIVENTSVNNFIFRGNYMSNISTNCLHLAGMPKITIENNTLVCNHSDACINLTTSFNNINCPVSNGIISIANNVISNYTGKCISALNYFSDVYNKVSICNNNFTRTDGTDVLSDYIVITNATLFMFKDNYLTQYLLETLRGTTDQRPSWTLSSLKLNNKGLTYYDTTLNKYILYNGADWVNLDGTPLT